MDVEFVPFIAEGNEYFLIKATHCVDMLASAEERESISEGKDACWLTPGWLKYQRYVFQDWDKGLANEDFPKHTASTVMVDGTGFWDEYAEKYPGKILDFPDWMGILLEPYTTSLDRLRSLLLDQIQP